MTRFFTTVIVLVFVVVDDDDDDDGGDTFVIFVIFVVIVVVAVVAMAGDDIVVMGIMGGCGLLALIRAAVVVDDCWRKEKAFPGLGTLFAVESIDVVVVVVVVVDCVVVADDVFDKLFQLIGDVVAIVADADAVDDANAELGSDSDAGDVAVAIVLELGNSVPFVCDDDDDNGCCCCCCVCCCCCCCGLYMEEKNMELGTKTNGSPIMEAALLLLLLLLLALLLLLLMMLELILEEGVDGD